VANGRNLPAGALLNKAMYKDTMMAYFHVTSYQKTNNGNLLALVKIQNADDLTYLQRHCVHSSRRHYIYCTLPATTFFLYWCGPE
jgi:hypothetical protein